jgi:hypothetical protein
MKNFIRAIVALLFVVAALPALAQTNTTYTLFSGIGSQNYTYQGKQCSGVICPQQIPVDFLGNPLFGLAGSPSTYALTVQGIASGQPVVVNCTTGCGNATAALQTTGNTALSTINTTLGSPFQAGGALAANQSVNNTQWNGVALGSPTVWGTAPTGSEVIGANVNCVVGCSSSTAITSWGGGTLGAMANYGTSPGTVLVPGVNAFITNTLTVQPGNTPNTTPWLATINQGGNSAAVTASNALKVDGSAVTQPVSIASSFPIPTGASTAALQTTGNSTLTTINTSLGTINTTLGSAATSALQTAGNASLATIATNTGLPIPAQSTHTVNIGATDSISPYPATAVPITASTTGTTAATTATLTNVTGHTTYICGFSIRANATSAATGNATVTGTVTGTLNYTQWTAPNSSGLGVTEEVFSPCVPANAVSTSIAVISAAPGTGGVVSVTAWGYSI